MSVIEFRFIVNPLMGPYYTLNCYGEKEGDCFYLREDKWFPGHAAFESVSFSGRFVCHHYLRLKLHSYISRTIFENTGCKFSHPGTKVQTVSISQPSKVLLWIERQCSLHINITRTLGACSSRTIWSQGTCILPFMQ